MSSRARTCKRACYRGAKWIRKAYWRTTRQKAKAAIAKGEMPTPARPRHAEKWNRE